MFWLMEQDIVKCIVWKWDTMKSLEDRGKLTCKMPGTMLFRCNRKHHQYLCERRYEINDQDLFQITKLAIFA